MLAHALVCPARQARHRLYRGRLPGALTAKPWKDLVRPARPSWLCPAPSRLASQVKFVFERTGVILIGFYKEGKVELNPRDWESNESGGADLSLTVAMQMRQMSVTLCGKTVRLLTSACPTRQ